MSQASVEHTGMRERCGRMTLATLSFAATLCISAFLLFSLELLVGKAVLPTLGGVPMVWNTCMVFFQVVLLCGYVFAHGATKAIGPWRHAQLYLVLLAATVIALPLAQGLNGVPPPGANPISWLGVRLAGWIGLPFFVLSASTALLQHWFARLVRSPTSDPYTLYSASNLGSLLALVSYPSLVEPTWPLAEQSRLWGHAYVLFAALASLCAVVAWRSGALAPAVAASRVDPSAADTATPSVWRRMRWVALSFVPSSLLFAITTYFSTDVAAVPLLWIVPLSIYLLTFVFTFGTRSSLIARAAGRALPLVLLPLAQFMVVQARVALAWVVPLHLAVFATVGLLCHGRLADDRPHAASLTEFYFWIACGGMLGGMFNTLAAPLVFNTVAEYPLALVLACFARTRRGAAPGSAGIWDLAVPLGVGGLTAGVVSLAYATGANAGMLYAALALPSFVAFSQSARHPARFALSMGALLLTGAWLVVPAARIVHTERTFFGVYRVGIEGEYRVLFNGTTLHGMQALDPARRLEPLTYYHRSGPVGQFMAGLPRPARVAVVGLGVGALAAYAEPGQRWTFFELDPAVERLARTAEYFTYLQECGPRCDVVLGDARTSLGRARLGQYDLIALDAFSSDAIPVHLLTKEAFDLYLSRLAGGGAVAVHVSNRHLALGPVVARVARDVGLVAVEERDPADEPVAVSGKSASDWLVLGRTRADLGALATDARWAPPAEPAGTPLWTDEFTSILSVLRVR